MMRRVLVSFLLILVPFVWAVQADDAAKPKTDPAAGSKDQDTTKNEVTLNQERLARQYREFEQALLTLAQRLERSSKPEEREKAALLKEAIKKSSEVQINTRFDKLVTLLKGSKSADIAAITDAMEKSQMLAEDIRAILQLLMSDNRDAQLKAEQDQLRRLVEMLDKVIREQKVVRAQTESGRMDPDALKKSQNKVTQTTEAVAKAMNKNGKTDDSKGDAKSKNDSKGKEDDKKGQPGDKSKGDDKKGQQGDKSKGDDKKGQQGDKSKGEKSKGDNQKGQPSDGKNQGQPDQEKGEPGDKSDQQQQPGEQTPGRKQVQDATQDQKRAEENIAKKDREKASKNQDDAIKKLEEARKKLEEILRQMREEEIERILAALRARCEQMLALQTEVYEGTQRIAKAISQNPDKKAGRDEELKSLQLSDREQEIVRLANKALELLEAEGSAVAFPEVFQQIRDDMKSVANRLGKVDVGEVTQLVEKDIIDTLKEMIEALKKAQQDQENKKNQPPPPPQSNNSNRDRSLIDMLAELRMIRSLQVRVNGRTVTYAQQYQGEQALQPEIQKELADLALRQQKIFEVTNNIARGKNK